MPKTKVQERVSIPQGVAPVVSQLIQNRRESGETAVPGVRNRRRNLEMFRNTAIYLLRIGISVGTRSVSLKYREMGLPEEIVNALEETRVSQPTLTIFRTLEKSANKLEGLKKKLQRRYMIYSEPYWFISERDIEAVRELVNEMHQECSRLKAETLDAYDENFEQYLAEVASILYAAQRSELQRSQEVEAARQKDSTIEPFFVRMTEEKIQSILPIYAEKFPTREKVEKSFKVTEDWGGRVPSLVEQSKEDADLAEAIARQAEAKIRQAESEQAQQFHQEWVKGVHEAFQEGLTTVKEEVIGIVAENLNTLEKMQVQDVQAHTKKRIRENLERLETLMGFDGSLEDLVNELRDTQFTAARQSGTVVLSQKLVELRKQLDEVRGVSGAMGHRSRAAQGMLF
ncbi:hypothetical protein H6G00_01700 [Leptolyngbya sp. FACHB-541]|uniref:hypothetical protein n=1 Tax=Leptolyngbya sp. FACHB-541 TaxID=2692810 RepID=UPI001686A3E3|nr:hypothetical protein [Leptolyngbya sp. FACHB-541]MBD1995345.1 hypothetical protein [Leptolyngbya sp. FACHB-541]